MKRVRLLVAAVALIAMAGCESAEMYAEGGTGIGTSLNKNLETVRTTNACPGCDLRGVDLEGAFLQNANLSGANLSGANLYQAMLIDADLSGADLSDANLQEARLRGANLSGANLSGANVYGAQFLGAQGLTPEQEQELKGRGALFRNPSF
jgi:uncharacterized protein YjbI with pentapeptide repeats